MKFSVIDPPYLVASSIPFNAKDIHALHQQGVRAIVSLTTTYRSRKFCKSLRMS